MENFFISCPLGLEQYAVDELNLKWKTYFDSVPPTISAEQGGIALTCELDKGLALNHILKSSNRILLRIKTQKCRDIPKLFNIILKIQWKKYLKRTQVNWNITCHESRLFNTKKIEKACQDALDKYFTANKLPQKQIDLAENFQIQNIYLRFENDELTLSIDTSGELLHIRGGDAFRGLASIRSTIASLLILKLTKEVTNFTLIDPMCGTGTFLKETRDFFKLSNRLFNYYDWEKPVELPQPEIKLSFTHLLGLDRDQSIIDKVSKENSSIEFKCSDVFKENSIKYPNPIIICNPPYGKRVKLDKPREIYYKEVIEKLRTNYNPKKLGILIPKDINLSGAKEKIPVFNSGIWLNFYIFEF